MRELFKLSLVLTIICCGAAFSLAYVYNLTKGPIAFQQRMKKIRAIHEVFPEYSDVPGLEIADFPWCDQTDIPDTCTRYYYLKHNNAILGTAFEVTAKGYGGIIELMVGVDEDLTIGGVKIIRHSETPGLGAEITTDRFASQFADLRYGATTWTFKTNGGDIDQISGATISSKAVMEAIRDGVDFFIEHRGEIMEKIDSGGTGQEAQRSPQGAQALL